MLLRIGIKLLLAVGASMRMLLKEWCGKAHIKGGRLACVAANENLARHKHLNMVTVHQLCAQFLPSTYVYFHLHIR